MSKRSVSGRFAAAQAVVAKIVKKCYNYEKNTYSLFVSLMPSHHNAPSEEPGENIEGAAEPALELDNETQALLDKIKNRTRDEYVALDLSELAHRNMPAALSILPRVIADNGLSQQFKERLTRFLFTEEQLREAAVTAMCLLVEDGYYSVQPGYTSYRTEWHNMNYRMGGIIHFAGLEASPRRGEMIAVLKKLLIDGYRYGHRDAPGDVHRMLRELGEDVPVEEITASVNAELEDALKAVVEGTDEYNKKESTIMNLSRRARDISPEIQALALRAYHTFVREPTTAKEYAENFSIPRDVVLAEADIEIGRRLHEGITDAQYTASTLQGIKRYVDTLDIPLARVEAKVLESLDEIIDAGPVRTVSYFFEYLGLDLACLEQEPRRTKMKAAFKKELERAYETRDDEGERVKRYEAMIDALGRDQPADQAEDDNDGDPFAGGRRSRGGEAERHYGHFSRWFQLGDIPVLTEVLDEELRSVVTDSSNFGARFRKFEEKICMPLDYVPSEETRTAVFTWAIGDLREGGGYRALLLQRCGIDPADPEIQDAAFECLLLRTAKNNNFFEREDALKKAQMFIKEWKLPADTMGKPEVRDAFRTRMFEEIGEGKLEQARKIADQMNLKADWKTDDGKAAALKGFGTLLQSRVPEQAFELARESDLRDTDMAAAIANAMTTNPLPTLRAIDVIPARIRQRLDAKFHLQTYADDLAIPSKEIYDEYCQLADARDPLRLSAYVVKMKGQLESLVSSGKQDPDIVSQPHYKELVEIVYPMNAGGWSSFEVNEHCEDRTDDLAAYKVRENYNFTVSPGSDMQLKAGRTKNEAGLEKLNDPVVKAHALFSPVGFEREKMLKVFDAEIAKDAANLVPAEAFATREEKIFGLMLEQTAGRFSAQRFRELLIAYQYAEFQDIRDYIDGTRGRAEMSRNPEYAYLLELREFFADRLKDVARSISDRALANPALQARLPNYFRDIAAKESARVTGDAVNKMQIDKLGLSHGFLRQIAKSLKAKVGTEYTDDQVRELIRDYEERTAGMADAEPPEGEFDRAIYSQIRSQRQKTIRAFETLSGTTLHPSEIRLEDMNLQEYLHQRRAFQSGEYDEKTFNAYLTHSFGAVFESELVVLDEEISKYEANDTENKDAKPKRVEAFITKNHTSAHARGTAGVCVAGDNPTPDHQRKVGPNQWQMLNYFQMVLRDANTKLCKGCVLLHVEEEGGKKYLTASMNPSSTYLYQVNEEEMFKSLRDQLITFAKDNNFDGVGISTTSHIRTNRTGGLFERAMDSSIPDVGQEVAFSQPKRFSFHPAYQQSAIHLIWRKESPTTPPAAV